MKQLLFAVGFLCTASAYAETRTVSWDQICTASQGNQLKVSTRAQGTVRGYCVRDTDNSLLLNTLDGRQEIARADVKRIRMRPQPAGLSCKDTAIMVFLMPAMFAGDAHPVLGVLMAPVSTSVAAGMLPVCGVIGAKNALRGNVELRIQ